MYQAKVKRLIGLSARRTGYFEEFVRSAKAHGTVKIWITPVHPRTKQALENSTDYTRLLATVRGYLENLGAEMSVPVYDFSEESNFNGSSRAGTTAITWTSSNAALITTECLTEGVRARGF